MPGHAPRAKSELRCELPLTAAGHDYAVVSIQVPAVDVIALLE
jgi:hypothetical protein